MNFLLKHLPADIFNFEMCFLHLFLQISLKIFKNPLNHMSVPYILGGKGNSWRISKYPHHSFYIELFSEPGKLCIGSCLRLSRFFQFLLSPLQFVAQMIFLLQGMHTLFQMDLKSLVALWIQQRIIKISTNILGLANLRFSHMNFGNWRD